MKYDDASWHYGGDFPDDLKEEAGSTHIGMFVAWSLLSDLGGSIHVNDFPDDILSLKQRRVTPAQFFQTSCDEKFWDEDLNEEGNKFATFYYEIGGGLYIEVYDDALCADLPSLYHVEDTWDNFDKLKPIIDARYVDWKKSKSS